MTGKTKTLTGKTKTLTGKTKTFTGKTKTLTGKTKTLTGKTKTLTGKTKTLTGKTKTLTGKTKTLTGKTKTLTGKTKTLTGKTKTLTGKTKTLTGKTKTLTGKTKTLTGKTKTLTGKTKTLTGKTKTFTGKTKTLTGKTKTFTGKTKTLTGKTKTLTGKTKTLTGKTKTLTGKTKTLTGKTKTLTGKTKILTGKTKTLTGKTKTLTGKTKTLTGKTKTLTGKTKTLTGKTKTSTGKTKTLTGKTKTLTGKTKTLTGKTKTFIETHHTNSILAQIYDIIQDFSKVSLKPDYDFKRRDHRSFKGTRPQLPSVNFARGSARHLRYERNDEQNECYKSTLKTLAWIKARLLVDDSLQMIPAWSTFQELSCSSDLDQVNVGYLPPIPNTPTDMKTIYVAIRRTQGIMEEMETNLVFIEVDQAIYTKVLGAMFRLKDEGEHLFDNIIPRLGGFHSLICMLRTIYSLFHNSGFVQLLSAAGLGGIGTVQKNLNGGDVKEGILLHKKLFEALLRSNIEYIHANGTPGTEETSEDRHNTLPALLGVLRKISISTVVENVLNSNTLKELPRLPGDMSTFMNIYLDMANMMLNFIHFLRTGNWIGYPGAQI